MEKDVSQNNDASLEILFVLRAFNLDGLIDGKRMTSIITNIKDRCKITVICFDSRRLNREIGNIDLENEVHTVRVKERKMCRLIREKIVEKKGISISANVIKRSFFRLFRKIDEVVYLHDYKKTLSRQVKQYSGRTMVVSCGVGESFLLDDALTCKNDLKLVVDFRDNLFFEGIPQKRYVELVEKTKRAYNEAELVTLVSEGQKEILLEELHDADSNKCKVLYNGFNNAVLNENAESNDCLTITYTGTVYNERHIEQLCELLSQVLAETEISREKLMFVYAGQFGDTVEKIFEKYRLSDVLSNRGMLSHKEALAIQKSSDILLVLTWNTQKAKGILTGKFFEYIGMKKPIFALVSGNLQNSEIKKIIEHNGFGYAYECAGGDDELENAKDYLLDQYQRKMVGLPLRYDADENATNQFSFSTTSDSFYNNIISL